jgi:hypothetical protein
MLLSKDINIEAIKNSSQLRTKSPYYIELSSLNDFGRFVCALEHVPLLSLSLNMNSERVYAVQTDFMFGRPIMFFVHDKNNKGGEYLAYRINGGVEEVAVVDYVSNPSFGYSPIINVDDFPLPLRRNTRTKPRSGYMGIKLKDLTSLVKVCAYKSAYDEPPLPLLLFEHKKSKEIVIGAATSLSETDDFYCFYYVLLDYLPSNPFVKYSSQKTEHPSFSSKLDEHGCIYLKVIKLASTHPLVNLDG